jgi:hypothetical protein
VASILHKDPQARLDYPFSWVDWLEDGDAIVSAEVTVPTGITLDGTTIVGSTVVAWLTGGTVNEAYEVTCHIETTDGRIDERTRTIRVRQR